MLGGSGWGGNSARAEVFVERDAQVQRSVLT